MTIRTARLEAELATMPDLAYVTGRTVVGIPPSEVDPISDEMRVAVEDFIILRPFDPGDDIITGAPIWVLTEGGDELLTEAGDTLVLEVAV